MKIKTIIVELEIWIDDENPLLCDHLCNYCNDEWQRCDLFCKGIYFSHRHPQEFHNCYKRCDKCLELAL